MELVDRMVETKNTTVLKALESKIEEREHEKLVLVSMAEELLPNAARFEECMEFAR